MVHRQAEPSVSVTHGVRVSIFRWTGCLVVSSRTLLRCKPRKTLQSGFTLMEMLVAIMILAMSLGALYQAVGGAMRAVGTDEKYVYAVE
ncbi:PulJ/GspJ family protein, partial [Klebsiella pneumoniae]|uniref:PulJ/GspJ family protein n=1 Tax=Klebsiella pneumoniae TaxID=573 RepID=UPI00351E1DC0